MAIATFIIIVLLVLQIIELSVFVILSIYKRRTFNREFHSLASSLKLSDVGVIIAAHENKDTITGCLDSLSNSGLKNVYLCLDGCDKNVNEFISTHYPNINIIINDSPLGKIRSQLSCLKVCRQDVILVLDADVRLIPSEVQNFMDYFQSCRVDFLCPYSIGIYVNRTSILSRLAEKDRHMRQRIVRAGRDVFGVSNLSGYCLMAKKERYIDVIDPKIVQDDVIATINLFKKKYTVSTYHRAVCAEEERSKFIPYILQKTRWTAGNIMLLSSYPKLFKSIGVVRAGAFSSSFLLWYWAWWIDCVALIFCFFSPTIIPFLTVDILIKIWGLYMVDKTRGAIFSDLIYCLLWPILSIICLVLSPYYIKGKIKENNTRRI